MRNGLPILLFFLALFGIGVAFPSERAEKGSASSEKERVSSDKERELALYPPELAINREGFSLFVLDEYGDIAPERRAHYDLRVKFLMNGDVFVSIVARSLPASQSSLFVLKFNPDGFSFQRASAGKVYGGSDESLFIVSHRFAGTVAIGLVRIRSKEKGFVQGDGLVAEVVFKSKPESPTVIPPITPTPEALVIEDFLVDNDGVRNVLTWKERLLGDNDKDGDVDLADAIPVGEYFFGQVGDGFYDEIEASIDANKDGIVNIEDLKSITSFIFSKIDGYNIYRRLRGSKEEAKLPSFSGEETFTLPRGSHQPFKVPSFTFKDATFTDDLPEGGRAEFIYRVVPVGPTGEGKSFATATIEFGFGIDVYAPHDKDDKDKPFKGILAVEVGDGRLKIVYKLDASDFQPRGGYSPSQKLRYFLWLGYRDEETGLIDLNRLIVPKEGKKVELTNVPSPFIWDDLNPLTNEKEPLINGQEYAVFISARDEAGNETVPLPGTVMFAKPIPGSHNDFEPPRWLEKEGIVSLVAGDGGVRVEFGTAVDIVSPPVRYRVYYSKSEKIDPAKDSFIEVTNSPVSVMGLTNNTRYFFLVRAVDSANRYDPMTSPNESPNLEVSSAVPLSDLGDVEPPIWVGSVGVSEVVAGDGSIRLHFGEAKDNLSPPVSYVIYYEKGEGISFSEATEKKVVTSSFPPPRIDGLENGQTYAVLVRAVDKEGNEEKNETVLTAKPEKGKDNEPPLWDEPGVRLAVPLDGAVALYWKPANDNSSPVTYRIYWQEGSNGITDYALAISEKRYLDTDKTQAIISGLVNDEAFSFAVRAIDSAVPPNEDYNTSFLVATPKASPSFASELVVDAKDEVRCASLCISLNGEPGIAYATERTLTNQTKRYALYFARKQADGWKTERIGTDKESLGKFVSLIFGDDDSPIIAFVNSTLENSLPGSSTLEICKKDKKGTWVRQVLDDGDGQSLFLHPALAVGESGRLGVTYIKASRSGKDIKAKLCFAEFSSGGWEKYVLHEVPLLSASLSSAFSGYPEPSCSLGFGTFDVEGAVRERAFVVFTSGNQDEGVGIAIEEDKGKFIVIAGKEQGIAYAADLAFMPEIVTNVGTIDWPRYSYILQSSDSIFGAFVCALKRPEGPKGRLFWESRAIELLKGCLPLFTNLEILRKDDGKFELTYLLFSFTVPPLPMLAIENLYTGEYASYFFTVPDGMAQLKLLCSSKKEAGDIDKLVMACASGSKLYLLSEW